MANLYGRLRDLLPPEPVSVVEVIVVHADGTATVESLAGSQYVVRGEGEIGAKVYVKGGIIQGSAPNLPYEDITV